MTWLRTHACVYKTYFNQLLFGVHKRSVLFEKWHAFFSTKNSKNTYCSGGCMVLNALNLEKWGVKIHESVILLEFLSFGYTTRMPLFSRISPVYKKDTNNFLSILHILFRFDWLALIYSHKWIPRGFRTLELLSCRMLYFDLWSRWLSVEIIDTIYLWVLSK